MATKTRKVTVRLPIHAASGMYVKCIGRCLNTSGKVIRKDWYFAGHDLSGAVTKIGEIQTRWKALQASGKTLWDEDPTYAAERNSVAVTAKRKASGKVLTVRQAVTIYTDRLKQQYEAGQFTKGHYTSQLHRLICAIDLPVFTDDPKTLAEVALPAVGRSQLEAVVLKLCSRPNVTSHHYDGAEEKHKGKLPTKKMSAIYAKACKASLKACFDWLAEEGLWRRCNHWKAIWKTQVVLTDDERVDACEAEDDTQHFDRDELVKLWRACEDMVNPDFYRCLILLGLNCGFANEEVASLKVREVKPALKVKFDDDQNPVQPSEDDLQWIDRHVIERYRGKIIKKAGKNAFARWYLWPETYQHLLKCQNNQGHVVTMEEAVNLPLKHKVTEVVTDIWELPDEIDERGLWFRTSDGKKLTDNNTIGQGWRRLVKRAKVRPYTFKVLRKTAAHLIRNELGLGKEIADMHLSHTDKGVIKVYAGRDWEGVLRPATERLRQHLLKMLTIKPKVKNADDQTLKLMTAAA